MPGKVIQCLKTVKTENPLILIDEVSRLFYLLHLNPKYCLHTHSRTDILKVYYESALPPQIGTNYIILSLIHPFDETQFILN